MKNYCRFCGEKLIEGQKHDCPKLQFWAKTKTFFANLLKRTGIENAKADVEESFERGKQIVPDTVVPDEGEIVVKQYDIAVLRSRFKRNFAEGRMQITNKRLLFRAAGHSLTGKTTYQCEFAMDKIDGVDICKDNRFLLFDLIKNLLITWTTTSFGVLFGGLIGEANSSFLVLLSLLVGISLCIPFFMVSKKFLMKAILLSISSGVTMAAIGFAEVHQTTFLLIIASIVCIFSIVLYWISMFLSFFQPNLYIGIQTSSGTAAIQVGEEWCGFGEVLPGKDADLAIQELGALINDIKTLGDLGIEKWQSK